MSPTSPAPRSAPGFIVFIILLNLVITADVGLDAPLIVKITALYGITDLDFSLCLIDPFLALTILFTFVWGYASDRVSRKWILFAAVLLGALFILGTGLALYGRWPFWAMASCRVLSGLGLAGVIPVSASMMADVVPPAKRAGIFAWMGIAGLLGTGLGFLISGLLAWMGVFVPYLIGAGLGLGFAIGVLFLRDPPRGQTEKALSELIARGKLDYAYRISGRQLLDLLRQPGNLYLAGFAFLFSIPPAGLGSFFITYLIRDHGFQVEEKPTLYIINAANGTQWAIPTQQAELHYVKR
jgi:MFS family permease